MLDSIFESLKKNNINLWLMYNRENKDKFFCKFISDNLSIATFAFITPFKVYLVVNELDKDNISKIKIEKNKVQIYIYNNSDTLKDALEDVFSKLMFPSKISLSYSMMSDQAVDVLGHGEYVFVTKKVKDIYKKYQKSVRFSSVEKVLYDVGSTKSALEILRMKLIAKITSKILESTFMEIKVGMTEIEISELTRSITEQIMNMYVGSNDIVDFDFAWDICPIVLTGENLTKGGHTLPSVKVFREGETIFFDFGIKVKFNDNMILNTDMQRMGYALKKTEKTPPKQVLNVFNTLVIAIDEGIERMKTGVKAYKIDDVVRKHIVKSGYPDYNHATGHSVGAEVHDLGAVITTKNNKRADLILSENSIYTLEPRIAIVNGGSIEEMILVTKFGGMPICNTQKKLYIIK